VALVASALAVEGSELRDERTSRPDEQHTRAGVPGEPRVGSIAASAPVRIPSASAVRSAWRFARRRGGRVSLAVVDTRGRLRGRDAGRRYVSASVVKAMLLVAELRRLRREALPLDSGTEKLLKAMITFSDNDSADAIYGRVGDAGVIALASSAHMRRFSVAAHWGDAQVTAADLARFFSRLRELLPRRHRRMALDLLASIVPRQRWGVPRAAGGRWTVHFKGGWRTMGRGELVHQAAWLHDRHRELAIAVLTAAQPSRPYAIHTVRGIADRLLGR
jgi:beta-lactamase family protein